MEDDYPNIEQALKFGSPAAPLTDPIFRMRATSYWAMEAIYRTFHMSPVAYHTTSLLLHIANTWLVYFALLAWPQTRAAAIWAAGFFAVHEGHQEAVMWFSAINELLQFFFGGLAFLLWMRGRRWLALQPDLLCAGADFEGIGGGVRGAFRFRADGKAEGTAHAGPSCCTSGSRPWRWRRWRRPGHIPSVSPMVASLCMRRSGLRGRAGLRV